MWLRPLKIDDSVEFLLGIPLVDHTLSSRGSVNLFGVVNSLCKCKFSSYLTCPMYIRKSRRHTENLISENTSYPCLLRRREGLGTRQPRTQAEKTKVRGSLVLLFSFSRIRFSWCDWCIRIQWITGHSVLSPRMG